MKSLTVLATLCLVLAAPARAARDHCGVWDLVGSEPAGSAGERIVVAQDAVRLPGCGAFRVDEVDTVSLSEDDGVPRRIRTVLRLRPQGPDGGCAPADDGLVRLEVTLTAGGASRGSAEFQLFRDAFDAPRLTAVGRAAATMPPVASRGRSHAIDAVDPVRAIPDRLGRGL